MINTDVEKIARRYCELMGLDPDKEVSVPDKSLKTYQMGPQWHRYIGYVTETLAMSKAIREVMKC